MTLPRVVSDLLMLAPSRSRVPLRYQYDISPKAIRVLTVAPVDACLSDPARSTSEILDTFSPVILVCGSRRFWVSCG